MKRVRHQADHPGALVAQTPRDVVRRVAELGGGGLDARLGLLGEEPVRPAVEHQRDGAARHPGEIRHILGGRLPCHLASLSVALPGLIPRAHSRQGSSPKWLPASPRRYLT